MYVSNLPIIFSPCSIHPTVCAAPCDTKQLSVVTHLIMSKKSIEEFSFGGNFSIGGAQAGESSDAIKEVI